MKCIQLKCLKLIQKKFEKSWETQNDKYLIFSNIILKKKKVNNIFHIDNFENIWENSFLMEHAGFKKS